MPVFVRSYVPFARTTLRAFLIIAFVAVASLGVAPGRAAAAGAANDHTVLVLGPTVTGGASSVEALAAISAGMTVEVVDSVGWAAKTAADFASYRALILGDPTCEGRTSLGNTTAAANALVWGPAVNGRVIIIGSDPVFHNTYGSPGGGALTRGGVQFVTGEAGKTGAYITLSCYFHATLAHTVVPMLSGLGNFTVTGVGCYNDAHIVATHASLAAVNDAALSNWSCSVHEAFDSWPTAGFDVLAIARGIGTSYTASDGSVGTPYILARGATVISDITLTPIAGSAAVGSSYTLTATIAGVPNASLTVTFSAIGGPNTGMTLTGVSNSSGQATATYSSTLAGTDTWIARFTRPERPTQTSNRATVAWGGQAPPPTTPTAPVVTGTSPSCGQAVISATGVTPGLPHQLVVTPKGGGTSQIVNVTALADQKVSATLTTGGGTFTAFLRVTSNQVTVSNTAIFTVAACAVATPTPTPTPIPVRTPTPTPTPTPAPIVQLPSTSTGGDGGLPISALAAIVMALAAFAWRKRYSGT